MSNEDLISVDYEIFGKVQGVFFRKYTQRERVLFYGVRHVKSLCFYSSPERTNQTLALHTAQGKKLGLVGWVQNTSAGTVQGQLQGPRSKVKEMQEWLKSTGSPKSHITKAEFKNEKTLDSLEHSSFNIVK